MDFVQFIENRFQELTLELQFEYIAKKDAELKALHSVITMYRTILRWLYMPKVLAQFFAVRMNWTTPPGAPLLDKLKREEAARKEAQATSSSTSVIPIHS